MSELRVHDLGPLEVSVGGDREPIRGRVPAAILMLLVVHANELVPVDTMVDAVWGESAGTPPVTPGTGPWPVARTATGRSCFAA